jgi:hypothetical protein
MIHDVHGKSQYGEEASKTLFGALVSPSQEAFTMLLYKNGYQNWVWMHHKLVLSSETSEAGGNFDGASDDCPDYLYPSRTTDLTRINGGGSRLGMLIFNKLYTKVKED